MGQICKGEIEAGIRGFPRNHDVNFIFRSEVLDSFLKVSSFFIMAHIHRPISPSIWTLEHDFSLPGLKSALTF